MIAQIPHTYLEASERLPDTCEEFDKNCRSTEFKQKNDSFIDFIWYSTSAFDKEKSSTLISTWASQRIENT